MKPRPRPITRFVSLVSVLLLFIGCATTPTVMSVDHFTAYMLFAPGRVVTPLEASATIEASATMTPELANFWQQMCRSPVTSSHYLRATENILAQAITQSGLFARIFPAGQARPDFLIKARLEEFAEDYPDNKNMGLRRFQLKLTLQVVDGRTGMELSSHSGATELGFGINRKLNHYFYQDGRFRTTSYTSVAAEATKAALQTMLPHLEASLAKAVQYRLRQPERDQAAAGLGTAPLPDLLVARDPTVDLARARNHALIAAKTKQLPDILRNTGTDGLTNLIVKVEQTVLDLDHEGALLNDRAQRLAANGNPQQMEALRGLAICYRERIELLKPIAAAIKEELANRNR